MKLLVLAVPFLLCRPGIAQESRTDKLPTPRAAVAAIPLNTPKEQANKAWQAARNAEIEAIKSGHPERVDEEELDECKRQIAREEAAARAVDEKARGDAMIAASDAKHAAEDRRIGADRQAAIKRLHCPQIPRIGTTETCVSLVLGLPDHENDDLRGLRQLVYENVNGARVYVYLDHLDKVEDVQIEH